LTIVLSLDLATRAGFNACYVDTPDLLEYTAASNTFTSAEDAANRWAQNHASDLVKALPLFDRVVLSTRVAGMTPDQTFLSSNQVVQHDEVRATCDGDVPDPPPETEHDDFYFYQKLFTTSGCSNSQRFHVAGSDQLLNRRVFIAGIVISLALAMLLEACVTGESRTQGAGSRDGAAGGSG
jgi:hypothetical protein